MRIHPYRTGDNRIDGATLVLIDIDESRQAREQLKAARDYAVAIVETVQDPLLILDAELRIVTASRSFYEAFRVAPHETEGQLVHELGSRQWSIPRLRTLLENILPGGSSLTDFEVEHDFPRIGHRTMLLNARRLHVDESSKGLILLSMKDITERKQLEEQLHQRVLEVTDASAAKDRFLASLSHELRTPLTPVLMTASALAERLDLTRIARGKLVLDLRPMDLCHLVDETLRICQGDLQDKQLHLRVERRSSNCFVMADGPRIQQVFWNLLRNAIKFTPPGGDICVEWHNDDRGWLIVSVSDTGVGIEPQLLPRLFQAFEQGSRETTRQYGGLGLGLAISKAIADLHGGNLRAESLGKGRGSTFTFEIPTSSEAEKFLKAQENSPALEAPPDEAPASQRILVVEDHDDTGRLMCQLLESVGHKVERASDIGAARQMAADQTFDLLISDLSLPDGSGLELMRYLKQKYGLKGIAVTGYGMEQDRLRTQAAGFAEHLVKPISFDQLRSAIARAADGS
jgi:two-component system CheB/CheR fusion protein